MPAKIRKTEIERFFDLYSSNLSFHDPSLKDIFVCPLCFRKFSRDAIRSHELTIEHVIPESIGGKLKTLTCQECNNPDGSAIDSHLVQRLRMEDKLEGKSDSPHRGKFIMNKGEFNADIYLSADKHPNIYVVGLPQHSDPRLHKLALEDYLAGEKEFTLEGRLGYKDIPSRVAIIRSAYLMMFRYFGYGYVIYDVTRPLRDQIANPNEETEVLKGIFRLPQLPPNTRQGGIAILKRPESLRCFLVLLNLSTEVQRYIGVVIPGLDTDSKNIYRRWIDFGLENTVGMKTDLQPIPYIIEFITNPKLKHLPVYLWKGGLEAG